MTIIQAITQLDSLKHNTYSQNDKVRWLSKLDGMVKKQIIDTHKCGHKVIFTSYDENTDINTELLIPAPYDDVYLRWLEAQIDYHNGEYDKYNNAILVYQAAYDAFANYYNRNHMPKGTKMKFF